MEAVGLTDRPEKQRENMHFMIRVRAAERGPGRTRAGAGHGLGNKRGIAGVRMRAVVHGKGGSQV